MATLTTLVSFDGTNEYFPVGGLFADAEGDLFGTTQYGGANNDGTVFELVNNGGSYNLNTLVSFNDTNGYAPLGNLIADAAGDLFGTTAAGGAGGYGTVFEIAKTGGGYASTPTTLASFDYGTNGAFPQSGLIADAAGNLFGTTQQGGAGGYGTVYELPFINGSYASTPTTLVSFNFTNGNAPFAGLIADAAGDLFGTTEAGGANDDGTVFEIPYINGSYASTPTTLVTFNYSNGAYPNYGVGLITDAAGDLFGATALGGAGGYGTVFEIAKTGGIYASTPTTLVSFNYSNGEYPVVGLIADAAGDLFGTTETGGAGGSGTVFEIAKTGGIYASTPTTLVSFNYDNGLNPYAGLIADAAGNLFGTTALGGANGAGTVFELSGTGFQVADTTVPSETVGGPYSGNENGSIALTGLSVSASPNAGDPLSTVLGVANGTLTVGAQTGASITLSGNAASIDTALASASYQGNLNYYGPDTLSLTTTDTADGNQASANAAITVLDTTAPSQTLPVSLSGVWDTSISLSGVSVAANPNTGDTLSTVLSVADGAITVGNPAGVAVSGSGTGSVTLVGIAAAIDAALATTGYLANLTFDGTDTLSVATTDTVDGNNVSGTVAITPNQVGNPDLGLLLGAGPVGADNWTNANHPMFAGVALPGSAVALYDGTTKIGNGQTNADGVWTITAKTLPLGTNLITARATDSLGHTTTSPTSDILMIPGISFQTSNNGSGNENANFQAQDQSNTFRFGNGAVVVISGNGSNQVIGGDGNDAVRLGNGPNAVSLGNGNDTITLGNGHNTLILGNGTDIVTAGNGPNTINLGGGNYTASLGTGSDLLVFSAPQALLAMPFANNDELVFHNSGFDLGVDNGKGTSTPQAIDPTLFGAFPAVGPSGDRFAYNQGTGNLYYSSNGSVASETLVAHLTNDPHLTAASLFFVS